MLIRGWRTVFGLVVVAAVLGATTTRPTAAPSALETALLAPHVIPSDEVGIVGGRPQLEGRESLLIDVDRDGDLDIVGWSSAGILAVWINDGANHYTRTVPSPRPSGLGRATDEFSQQADGTTLGVPPTAPRFAAEPAGRETVTPDVALIGRPTTLSLRPRNRTLGATPARAPPTRKA